VGWNNSTQIILNFGKIGVLEGYFSEVMFVFGLLVGFLRAQMRKLLKKQEKTAEELTEISKSEHVLSRN